jgi:cytochrome c oxidase subunit 4
MSDEKESATSYGTLLAVLGSLLALTALTVAASRIEAVAANIWITLMIASAKASLVLLFFMRLKREKRAFMYAFLSTILLAAVFIGFLFWDVAYRAID